MFDSLAKPLGINCTALSQSELRNFFMYIIKRVTLLDSCMFPFLGFINCTRYVLLTEFPGKMHRAASMITINRRCSGL